MRAVITLGFLLSFACLGMAQEVLFYDNFNYADSRIKRNLNTLRGEAWEFRPGNTCHAVNLEGVGGVAYAVQFDNGSGESDLNPEVQCVANTRIHFRIDPGALYTHTVKFRINEYDDFFAFHVGFQGQHEGGQIQASPTLSRDRTTGTDYLDLQVLSSGVDRYTVTPLSLRPYSGQWLLFVTELNTRSDDQILLTSSLTTVEGKLLATRNIVLTEKEEIDLIRGQSFGLHNHPLHYLSGTERVVEIKEVLLIKN